VPPPDPEILVREYARPIHAYLWRLLRDPSAAEECLQETFLRVATAAARGDPVTHPRAWLYAVATNTARSYGREIARRERREQELDPDLEDRSATVPEAAERRARLRQVESAVGRLPPKQRTALVLRKYQGLSYDEVGAALGCSPASARANVYQALRHMREWLGEEEDS
jgi:RNA polymerase sigma-70 factor (ECF subfamily)